MRIQVLEDRNCFLTRLKYYMESAAHAQERFDSCRPKWRRADEPDKSDRKEIRVFREGEYYVIQVKTGMFPMPPPVWFAKKNLRPDQIGYLEDAVKSAADTRPR